MRRWFAPPTLTKLPNLDSILFGLEKMEQALRNNTLKVECCDCAEADTNAWANYRKIIHLCCNRAFWQAANFRDLFGNLFHEMLHYYGPIGDVGYYRDRFGGRDAWGRTAASTPADEKRYKPGDNAPSSEKSPRQNGLISLTELERLNNASTWDEFLKEFID